MQRLADAIERLCAEAEAEARQEAGQAVHGRPVGADAEPCAAVTVECVEAVRAWSRHGAQPFVAASVIKLPILAAAYEAAAHGELDLAAPVSWAVEDQVMGSGVLRDLTPGGSLPLRDVLTLMIVLSDNTATNLAIERVGIGRVNAFCTRYGLHETRLLQPLMVVRAGVVGRNTVSARDAVRLLAGLARGEVVSWDASRRMIALLKRQQVRDALPALLPERSDPPLGTLPAWELANKTGGVPGYQHDAGLLFVPGRCVALAVLTRGLGAARAKRLIARIARAAYDHVGSGGDAA